MRIMYLWGMIISNPAYYQREKRPSEAVIALQAKSDAAMQAILSQRETGMDPAGNAVSRYVRAVGETTLSVKLAIAACVDPSILDEMKIAGCRFDSTPDERGTTAAMIFAARAKSAGLIAKSRELGADYDPDLRDVDTKSVAGHAQRNDRYSRRKDPDIVPAVAEAITAYGESKMTPRQRLAARQSSLPGF